MVKIASTSGTMTRRLQLTQIDKVNKTLRRALNELLTSVEKSLPTNGKKSARISAKGALMEAKANVTSPKRSTTTFALSILHEQDSAEDDTHTNENDDTG